MVTSRVLRSVKKLEEAIQNIWIGIDVNFICNLYKCYRKLHSNCYKGKRKYDKVLGNSFNFYLQFYGD